jgi:diguanylate cyclase (GGDEF)-like protein
MSRGQALFHLSSVEKSFTDLPLQVTHSDGHALDLLASGEPTYGPDGTLNGWSGVIHDVTQERVAQRELEARSLRDPLTELGNRHCFKLEVSALIQVKAPFILTLIDLDRFKSINDAEGHHAGDRFLVEIASRLRSGAGQNETVYRLSGDEFVMVSMGEQADELRRVLTDTLRRIRPDRALDPISMRAFASAGSARFPGDAQDFDGLLIAADIAMYTAKRQGGHRHLVYSQSLSVEWQQRATLTQALTRALETEQVYFHYQPIFRNGGTEIAGFEALLRWDQCPPPILGPLEIVNYAEQHGLAPLLTRWSLRCIAKDGSALLRRCPHAYVALNVTPSQAIDPQLPQQLADFMLAQPEWLGRVVVELTEGPTAIPEHSLNEALTNVVNAGVTVALDDFGSGMSSLQRLLALPLSRLKLDRFLVQGIENDQPRGDFVRAMVALAHSHGLTVTAEGVETWTELQTLCDAGADEFQGYWLGRPASIVAIDQPRDFGK